VTGEIEAHERRLRLCLLAARGCFSVGLGFIAAEVAVPMAPAGQFALTYAVGGATATVVYWHLWGWVTRLARLPQD
jgi:hypothetical protein